MASLSALGGGDPTGGAGVDWFGQQGTPGGLQAPGGSPTFNEAGPALQAPAGGAAPAGNPTDRDYIRSQLANWYASQGLTPTGPGTGPTDIEYYTNQILNTGGWTNQTGKGEDNIGYWTSRIPQDLARAGGGGAGGAGGGLGGMAGGLDPSAAGRLGYTGGLGLNVDMTQDPGYQFRLQQGQQALEHGAAAKGTLLTGGTAKGLARYAQDYASQEYGNAYSRAFGENQAAYGRLFGEQQNRYQQLAGLANLGQSSAAGQAASNSAYANTAGNLLTDRGNAQAAGTVGAANATNTAIGQGINAAQMYYLSRLFQPGGGGGGWSSNGTFTGPSTVTGT